jgi:hypothetical protein
MQFSVSVLLASLAATAIAAPTSPDPSSVLEKRENYCGDSAFVNASSGGSPLIQDCQQLSANIAGGGSWVRSNKFKQNGPNGLTFCSNWVGAIVPLQPTGPVPLVPLRTKRLDRALAMKMSGILSETLLRSLDGKERLGPVVSQIVMVKLPGVFTTLKYLAS